MEAKALKLYNKKLKEIEKNNTGNKTTYLSKLNKEGKKLLGKKFHGVYPSDKIPKLTNLKCYCILNVDNSNEAGSHWLSLAKNKKNNSTMFYDSFGRNDTEIIPNLKYSGNGKIINTDDDTEQEIIEENCGARCLAWLCLYDEYGEDTAILI